MIAIFKRKFSFVIFSLNRMAGMFCEKKKKDTVNSGLPAVYFQKNEIKLEVVDSGLNNSRFFVLFFFFRQII